MTKAKSKAASVPHRHTYSRVSFLFQAATYLSSATGQSIKTPVKLQTHDENSKANDTPGWSTDVSKQSQILIQHLRGVSLKSQTRLSSAVKRAICKRCNTLLIPGKTSTYVVENLSRNGRKPVADVFVIRCRVCSTTKRFPVGLSRQQQQGITNADAGAKAIQPIQPMAATPRSNASDGDSAIIAA